MNYVPKHSRDRADSEYIIVCEVDRN